MGRSCRQIEALLDQRARGLDEAGRLRVEAHLTVCASCRETAAMLRLVGRALGDAPAGLSEVARGRAIGRALDSTAFAAAERRAPRWLWPTASAAIAAAGLLAWGLSVHDVPPPVTAHVAGATRAASRDAPPERLAARALPPKEGGQLAPRERAVEPVAMPSSEGVTEPQAAGARRQFAGTEQAQGGELASASRDVDLVAQAALAQAREALARGDTKGARHWIERAEASSPRRRERAEAETLRAESALLDHDASAALAHYLTVAARYSELNAGENALFAAAQLAGRSADRSRQSLLLKRYLKRYPAGRFVDEARARLTSPR